MEVVAGPRRDTTGAADRPDAQRNGFVALLGSLPTAARPSWLAACGGVSLFKEQ